MESGPTLEIADGTAERDSDGVVPPPLPPDDPEAWYAPEVRAQYELAPDVVATITETEAGFEYRVREPILSERDETALDAVLTHFDDANLARPVTREGTRERMDAGFEAKYERMIDRLIDPSHSARRRIDYHALTEIRCLGRLTPLALDDRIEVADAADDRLVVHTERYAPAETDLPADPEYLDRFVSERLTTYSVSFREFDVPVVVYREHLIGTDAFTTRYAVREPDLLPGDRDLIDECKDRIWEQNVDGLVENRGAFVRDRAELILSRLLMAENTKAWLDATKYRLRTALSEYGFGPPPVDSRFSDDRLTDLVYYVLRDYVGEGKLTIPIRDRHLEDIEANRVGERVKVVPRADVGHGRRIPTDLSFEDETEFVNVVTQLAAADGTELNASNPSAKVNLRPDGVPDDVTIRCAVALPVISEEGPHVSIRKQAPEAMTPVDLLEQGSLPTELVALLWMLYEHHCVVLFSGPTGAGKTTLMNAHMPFIPFRDRPISIDEGSREVRMPHETGVSLTTREHETEYKRVTMADLMTECNYLNPDIEVIAEINTPASFETYGEVLNTGHGVLGTTHAEDVEKLVNRVVEQGLPPYLLREIDLVVFPKHVDGERYVADVVEFVGSEAYNDLDGAGGRIEKDGTTVYWNRVARRNEDGSFRFAYSHPRLAMTTDDDAGAGRRIGRRLDLSAFDDDLEEGSTDGPTEIGGGRNGSPEEPSPAGENGHPPEDHSPSRASRSAADDPWNETEWTAATQSRADEPTCDMRVFHRIAERTDRPVQAVEAEFHRKHRYVRYLQRDGMDDFEELFAFLADLETNEAATVERLRTNDD